MPTNLKILRTQRGLSLRAAGALVGATGQAQMQWERLESKPIAVFRERLEAQWGHPLDDLLAQNDESTASVY